MLGPHPPQPLRMRENLGRHEDACCRLHWHTPASEVSSDWVVLPACREHGKSDVEVAWVELPGDESPSSAWQLLLPGGGMSSSCSSLDTRLLITPYSEEPCSDDLSEQESGPVECSESWGSARRDGAWLRRVVQGQDIQAALQAVAKASSEALNSCDPVYGWSVLHGASFRGHAEVCEAILTRTDFAHANSTCHCVFGSGWTALHLAAEQGRVKVCQVLINAPEFTAVHLRTQCAHEPRTAIEIALQRHHIAAAWAILDHCLRRKPPQGGIRASLLACSPPQ
mmetsp:Transcript_69428/g.166446  ORF Transcript_69428/g.166446 Transcript_69428/m.166446 type:complete len:282 (-) Transcript_69428:114-959(-)